MPANGFHPGRQPQPTATRWAGYKPFPLERTEVPLRLCLSPAEYAQLAAGWSAQQGDPWHIVFEEPWLLASRPYQRTCIYAMRFEPHPGGYQVVQAFENARPGEALPGPASPERSEHAALAMQTIVLTVVDPQGPRMRQLMARLHTVNARLNQQPPAPPAAALHPDPDPRLLLGAIVGDVVGSSYEAGADQRGDVPLITPYSKFTDDTVMTCAVAEAILLQRPFAPSLRRWGRRYPMRGYGERFEQWLVHDSLGPYGSWGNGGAMRASAVGLGASSLPEVLATAAQSAACTHNHPQGIQGAQAAALGVWLARQQAPKADIRQAIEQHVGYSLQATLAQIRPGYGWSGSAHDSVPQAIQCFLEADSYEATLRNVLSLGGDADTMGAIAGAMAAAWWGGVPRALVQAVEPLLHLNIVETVNHFSHRFGR
jgi:ADP-ribosylglycohydrolase